MSLFFGNVQQGISVIDITYDFSDSITTDVDDAIAFEGWQLVDIIPLDRITYTINVKLAYLIEASSETANISTIYYGIGVNDTSEPSWIEIDSVTDGGLVDTDIDIEVEDGEYLFVKIDITHKTTSGNFAKANLTLEDGNVIGHGSSTATASGSPLVWNKIKSTL